MAQPQPHKYKKKERETIYTAEPKVHGTISHRMCRIKLHCKDLGDMGLNKKIRYIVVMGLEGGKGKTETSIKGKKENEKEEN